MKTYINMVTAFGMMWSLAAGAALADPLANGDFEAGLSGWVAEGNVSADITAGNDAALFLENPSGDLSRIHQVFELPTDPRTLSFRFSMSWFPTPRGDEPRFASAQTPTARSADSVLALRDSALHDPFPIMFEPFQPLVPPPDSLLAFLLDPVTLERLLPPPGEPPLAFDDYFYTDNTGVIDVNPSYVTVSPPEQDGSRIVTLDISSLPPGTQVRLEFGLAGFPDGNTTFAFVDDVVVTNNLPIAQCQDAAAPADDDCCAMVTVADIDDGSFDPDGPGDVAELCITAVDGQPGGCAQEVEICGIGTHGLVLTIEDSFGTSDSCMSTVTVLDLAVPVITCPSDVTVDCSDSTDPANTGSATATDNCDPAPVVTWSDAPPRAAMARIEVSASGGMFAAKSAAPRRASMRPSNTGRGDMCADRDLVRTWMAVDASGNSTTCTQTIHIVDSTAPVITCPPDITITCGESTDPANTGMATAIDDCSPVAGITYSDSVSGTCPGTITRTWTAADACGNSATCVQTITLSNDLAMNCPADAFIECDQSSDPANTGFASASGGCPGDTLVTYEDQTAGTCPTLITRTWTAEDSCGVTVMCTQDIESDDTTPPMITCPQNLMLPCETADGVAVGNVLLEAGVLDNCDPAAMVEDDRPADFYPIGTTTVTFTATDACMNVADCTVDIIVDDSCLMDTLSIDVQPGRFPNPVILSVNYTIYVGILDDGGVDLGELDAATIRFGPTGTEAAPQRAPIPRDLNGDGVTDLLLGFWTFDCGFSLGDQAGILRANLLDGSVVEGQDSVQVSP